MEVEGGERGEVGTDEADREDLAELDLTRGSETRKGSSVSLYTGIIDNKISSNFV